MDRDMAGITPREGMTIVGSDGETVGEIDAVESTYVIVQKGLFPQDYYIPLRDIASQDEDGTLHLAIPADEALERGFGNPAVAFSTEDTGTSSTVTHPDDVSASTKGDLPEAEVHAESVEAHVDDPAVPEAEPVEASVEYDTIPETEPVGADAGMEPESAYGTDPALARDEVRDDMHRTVTLSEEELEVSTRPVEKGIVRVEKKVVEERQAIEVPLVEDEVQVTRRRVDREITDQDHAFEEGTIEIPLRGQGVEIEKRASVFEEVQIDKSVHEHVEQVTETVRHERARVEGDGVEEVSGDTDARLDRDDTTTT
jgi:uncharacterized protein (TIGR02271 family)